MKINKYSNEHIVLNGRASFYACILEDLKKSAHSCGWALGLHGSLQSDMDIMAMPWTEEATSAEVMIKALADCFVENNFDYLVYNHKPNNRVVYSIPIWGNWYLDINVIDPNKENKKEEPKLTKEQIREINVKNGNDDLYDDPGDCIHDVKGKLSGGVKCSKCSAWFCY